jgi:nucleotide-binding universal stress UspA family protein
MKEFRKIALFADLTEMDELLLKFIKGYDRLFDFEELYLVHQIEVEALSPELKEMLDEKNQTLEGLIEEDIQSKIDEVFGPGKSTIKTYIHPRPDFSELVQWLNKQKFDLVFLGKKKGLEGSGIFSSKLVRLLRTNLILIPETARATITDVVVPIDFSDYSPKVLQSAEFIAQKTDAKLTPLHVLKIGIHYFPFVAGESQIQKSLEKEARSKFEKLKKKAKTDRELLTIRSFGKPIGNAIYNKARELNSDLIIISKKGKSDDEDLLIGSVAENLIANDKDISVMILQ